MDTFYVELSICNLNMGYMLPWDGEVTSAGDIRENSAMSS